MIGGDAHLRELLAVVVGDALSSTVFLDAKPTHEPQPPGELVWSWVKVVEPVPGTVALALPQPLAELVARAFGGPGGSAPSPGDIRDAQGELTNIIAGRLAGACSGGAMVSLGIPRTGRGAPDVSGVGWVCSRFRVGANVMAVHVVGEGLRPAPATERTAPARSASARLATPPPAAPTDETVAWASDGAVAAPDEEQAVPARIGQYEIIGKLGEGGMGVVYRAHHAALDRTVALKVMKPELARDRQFAERFLREARAAALIDHPNIVTVFDAGDADGQLYIAMRFVAGGDLATLLRNSGSLAENRALVLTAQCLMGLRAIHAAGMIHRDIKPANILLETDLFPRIADLGLARSVMADDGLSRVNAGAQGTPSYMAPEQARGASDIDGRCDLYSIACTTYAMLSGAPPFRGDSAFEIVAKVIYEEPPALRSRSAAVSAEAEAIIMRGLAKNPAERWPDAEAFLEAVEDLLIMRGVSEWPGTGSSTRRRAVNPRPESGEPAAPVGWLDRIFQRNRSDR